MRRQLIATGAAIVLAIGAAAASSDDDRRGPNHFRATLSGYQETPSTISTGARGQFKAELVTDALGIALEYELSYQGIEGGAPAGVTPVAFAAHIHLGARATTGGISAFLCGNAATGACPTSRGTVTGTIRPANVQGPAGQGIDPGEFDELIRAMRAGATYANVHSTPNRTGGEIRGQILARHDRDDR